ncbi:hypothetical protein [Shewanella xiamenensis]|uniref:hypothetical protein n=1 Tax=Shewanella xiamenensis TaxID=332186 RepID=UPI0024A63F01|nr:hypothetical protein [Shewanella xiamenensis]MDI5834458.1 hypothetical protein [Shewanella xiamenensis]MDI5838398.1 hypothetical protein [Shewanella xiamenensis]MDI5842350.1 hypothetical protein [Shewanella xiamenensis]MDI5847686.1 hypothetical protein [Shewanella xiamenensis]MDI5850247.1 hypothetical protein [Shewanella xiamenensis]
MIDLPYLETYEQPYKMECKLLNDRVFNGDIKLHRQQAGEIGSVHEAYFNTLDSISYVWPFQFVKHEVIKTDDKITIHERGFGTLTFDPKLKVLKASHYGTTIEREMTYSCVIK